MSVLAEPSFVFADVMRERPEGMDSGDARVYFFFTEVSVEYEFVFKLMIPRVARVCKVRGGLLACGSGPGRSRVWRVHHTAQAPRFLQNVDLPTTSSFCGVDGCGRAARCSACPGAAWGDPRSIGALLSVGLPLTQLPQTSQITESQFLFTV